jgi:transcription antitermination factor NusG
MGAPASKLEGFRKSLDKEGLAYDPRYYCLRTKGGRHDAAAAASLHALGLPVIFPLIKETVRDCNERLYQRTAKLFPGYVFAHFDVRYLRSLGYVQGVATIVGQGGQPEEVSPAIIDEIVARIGPDGYVRLDRMRGAGARLSDGAKVEIKGGVFAGFTGAFVEGLSSDERVTILLDSVYRSTIVPRVQVHRSEVALLRAS